MNAELEILGVKLKHYHVDAAMEIVEANASQNARPEELEKSISRPGKQRPTIRQHKLKKGV